MIQLASGQQLMLLKWVVCKKDVYFEKHHALFQNCVSAEAFCYSSNCGDVIEM